MKKFLYQTSKAEKSTFSFVEEMEAAFRRRTDPCRKYIATTRTVCTAESCRKNLLLIIIVRYLSASTLPRMHLYTNFSRPFLTLCKIDGKNIVVYLAPKNFLKMAFILCKNGSSTSNPKILPFYKINGRALADNRISI